MLGGLLHELVQSQGKFVLPNTADNGNLALGGLVGVITGGIAGVVLYSGLTIAAGTKLTSVVFANEFWLVLQLKELQMQSIHVIRGLPLPHNSDSFFLL